MKNKNKKEIEYTGLQPVVNDYDPEKAYPRLKPLIWRDLEKPGPCRSLTREEIEREYTPKENKLQTLMDRFDGIDMPEVSGRLEKRDE